jgi:predicted outer membrane repeat protein
VYDITYSYEGFFPVSISGVVLGSNTQLDLVMLLSMTSRLGGELSGEIGPGDFHVIDNLFINEGDTLIIKPGTTLRFNEELGMNISGHLSAIGTEADSIRFTISNSNSQGRWRGIDFDDGSSEMGFCLLEYAYKDEGGCFDIDYHTLFSLTHSTLRHNIGHMWGGTIHCQVHDASLEPILIESCVFENNGTEVIGEGGAVFVRGPAIIRDCKFIGNTSGTEGGAAYIGSDVLVEECLFVDNSAFYGGAILASGSATIRRCTFVANRAEWEGAALYCETPNIECKNSIFTTHEGSAVHFTNSADCELQYCGFFGNNDGNFSYGENDTTNGPAGIGVILTENANGYPADAYYNIFENPLFAGATNGDYRLSEGSPCIDAGDPLLPYDPDGTVSDIGAFYYPQTRATRENNLPLPADIILHQNYPNPFNATTSIEFEIPSSGLVKLELYDIQGRFTATLLNNLLSAGLHQIKFNGSELPSGVYFYRLTAQNQLQIRKMVILK